MRVLVAVKRVPDPGQPVRVAPDQSGVDLAGVRMIVNPYDEVALEAAVRLKEIGVANEVVAVSIGAAGAKDTLRSALALGADRAMHGLAEDQLPPLAIARALRDVVADEQPRLVLLGRQAVDDGSAQVGPMLAALLDWPQATNAVALHLAGDVATVERIADGGVETLEVDLPAVVTADLRLNTPRFATLAAVLRAKKETIAERIIAAGPVAQRTIGWRDARRPRAGARVTSAGELVAALRRAGVL